MVEKLWANEEFGVLGVVQSPNVCDVQSEMTEKTVRKTTPTQEASRTMIALPTVKFGLVLRQRRIVINHECVIVFIFLFVLCLGVST